MTQHADPKDPVWHSVPMPEDYTCHCGIYVHPTRRNDKALHIADCPYAPRESKEEVTR